MKITSKWSKELHVRSETENVGGKLPDIGTVKDVPNRMPLAQEIMPTIGNRDSWNQMLLNSEGSSKWHSEWEEISVGYKSVGGWASGMYKEQENPNQKGIKQPSQYIAQQSEQISERHVHRGQWAGWAAKSVYCSSRTQVKFFAPTWQLATICNSSPRESHTLFWPPWTLVSSKGCIDIHASKTTLFIR